MTPSMVTSAPGSASTGEVSFPGFRFSSVVGVPSNTQLQLSAISSGPGSCYCPMGEFGLQAIAL